MADVEAVLLEKLTDHQKKVVKSDRRRLLVVAGAGSGKTEVMARRVAWWVAVDGVPKENIVAFTFTEAAAEELKFRIRHHVERITPEGEDVTLGGMYVGTIHGFCLRRLRELRPNVYHNFDVIDEGARLALVQRGYFGVLGLRDYEQALGRGQFFAMESFLEAYDLLNEYDLLDVELPSEIAPHALEDEKEWCKRAKLKTKVGRSAEAEAFASSAARYYAYLRCRRFLDFSTSQSELVNLLRRDAEALADLRTGTTHLVVDEVQDINPVQEKIIRLLVGDAGHLTAVGDHRQAIYAWRGGRVQIMGALHEELRADREAVLELEENFRSTKRILEVANRWAATIGSVRSMRSADMRHGRTTRVDQDAAHVTIMKFQDRAAEARWIADSIAKLVVRPGDTGAVHDTREGARGISYADLAVLIRSSTDARTYMRALEDRGIPAVFRAGPDLFSQPEVLLLLAVLARSAGMDQFFGVAARSLPQRIAQALGCDPKPEAVITAACAALRAVGLPLDPDTEGRLLLATTLVAARVQTGTGGTPSQRKKLRTPTLVKWLEGKNPIRRVFPQSLFHYLLAETGVGAWENVPGRGTSAMFHLGQLSALVKGVETPGWTSAGDFRYQVIALCLWGAQNARSDEAPLLVQPDAVTISTVHGAKGLEFAAVFLADVCGRRFPSQRARTAPSLPFDGAILRNLDPADLADNDNLDQERRLMYVALTRAERHLYVSCSGGTQSSFFKALVPIFRGAGAGVDLPAAQVPRGLRHQKSEFRRDVRLVTSFSDMRYYLECPHDFYLRKVLGFAPTIDQAFGYGRAVHNLLRAVHDDAEAWAKLAKNPAKLEAKLEELVERGLFYLRYTTGDPAENMRRKGVRLVRDYVRLYAPELEKLTFEPEREFETLIEEEQVLVSGAIDVVRLDDPPRVTLIDFKSGESESEALAKLDEDEMRLQVSLYGLAAKKELEYEPELGLVRYLDETDPSKRELAVNLDDRALAAARKVVVETAGAIRNRLFHAGPRKKPRDPDLKVRCAECDFGEFCGMEEARRHRSSRPVSPRRPS